MLKQQITEGGSVQPDISITGGKFGTLGNTSAICMYIATTPHIISTTHRPVCPASCAVQAQPGQCITADIDIRGAVCCRPASIWSPSASAVCMVTTWQSGHLHEARQLAIWQSQGANPNTSIPFALHGRDEGSRLCRLQHCVQTGPTSDPQSKTQDLPA